MKPVEEISQEELEALRELAEGLPSPRPIVREEKHAVEEVVEARLEEDDVAVVLRARGDDGRPYYVVLLLGSAEEARRRAKLLHDAVETITDVISTNGGG